MGFINRVLNSVAQKAIDNNKHVCPICYHELNFQDFKILKGEHLLCPRCRSFDRHRLLYLFLLKKTDFFKQSSKKILHVSPFKILYETFRRIHKENYISVGLNQHCDARMDITTISYEDNEFGSFICSHVLEHIVDDDKAISKLYRVLSVGGWGIINVPIKGEVTFEDDSIITDEGRRESFGESNHVRLYGKDLYKKLEKYGFKVNIFEARDFLTEKEIVLFNTNRQSLKVEMPIIYCRK